MDGYSKPHRPAEPPGCACLPLGKRKQHIHKPNRRAFFKAFTNGQTCASA